MVTLNHVKSAPCKGENWQSTSQFLQVNLRHPTGPREGKTRLQEGRTWVLSFTSRKLLVASTQSPSLTQKVPNQIQHAAMAAYLLLTLSWFPCPTRVVPGTQECGHGDSLPRGPVWQPGQARLLPWRAPPAGIWSCCFLNSRASPCAPTCKA